MTQMSEPISLPRPEFWKSLPGVLTAVTSLITAVAGLGELGLIGGSRHGAPQVQESRAAEAVPLHRQRARAGRAALVRYTVHSPGDGFATLRQRATRYSPALRTLTNGTVVGCGPARLNDAGGRWRFCPAERGWISARLLRPAGE